MSKPVHKALRIGIPLLLGISLIAFIYWNTSPSDRSLIIENIFKANPFWVAISLGIGLLSHLSRALRWNYLLQPIGFNVKVRNSFLIIMMAYLANLGVPRSGEFLRATALTAYEKVPFEKGFGTIVIERVIDVLMLLIIIFITFIFQATLIGEYLNDYGINLIMSIAILVLGITGLFITLHFIKKTKNGLFLRIKEFLNGILEGVSSILKIQNKWPFFFHTMFIWVCYTGMFWAIKYAIPGTENLEFSQLLVAFVAGAFAMMLFPGGLGGYPVFVSAALAVFGIASTAGDAYGWLLWISQTLLIVIMGAISFVLLPLLNQDR